MPPPLELPELGKVTAEWFADNPYAADSSVHAYVIADDTRSWVSWQDRGQYNLPWLVTERRRVVRVLDARGIDDHATVRLGRYAPKGETRAETLRRLEAYAHVYDGGRLTSTPVEADAVYERRISPNVVETTFSFAGVRPGAVLDLAYREEGGYIQQQRVFLQESIPVEAADYTFRMGPEFGYKASVLGTFPVAMAREESRSQGNILTGKAGRDAKDNVFRFAVRDAPALRSEAYVTTVDNYRAQAAVELERYARPSTGQIVDFATTWDDIAERLRDGDGISAAMRAHKDKRYLAWAAECPQPADASDLERADWALRSVGARIAWTGRESYWPSDKVKTALEAGKGHAGDVNGALLGLMRALGLEAYPVYLSTREHGYFRKELPDQGSLNHLIVALVDGDDLALYDATNATTGQGVVPTRDLNGTGLLVEEKSHRFVDLQAGAGAQRGLIANLTLGDDRHLDGTFTLQLKDYGALPYTDFDAAGALTIDPEELGELFAGYAVADVTAEPTAGYGYAVTGTLRSREPVLDLGGALALDPTLGDATRRNPFSAEQRSYPVEFPYRRFENRQVTIHLPTGYRADDLPPPSAATMPDRGVMYRTGIQTAADPADGHTVLTYSTVLAIKTLTYPPEAYPALRQLYDVVAERESHLVSVVPSID